jgi:L-cysteine desulfidase
MSLLKKILNKDVHPALGCTEPIAIAYASSLAMDILSEDGQDPVLKSLKITVDPGIFKNGMGVTIPNSFGRKGNRIAGALGALCGNSKYKLEVLKDTTNEDVQRAEHFLASGAVKLICNSMKAGFHIQVQLESDLGTSEVVIEHYHTNVVKKKKNGKKIQMESIKDKNIPVDEEDDYKEELQDCSLEDLVELVNSADQSDLDFIHEGIEMNMAVAREGQRMGLFGSTLLKLQNQGLLAKDVFSEAECITACATDARMNGCSLPVMSSGGSGNQGIVAILVPYIVGMHADPSTAMDTILRSIALSHLINAQVKCYTGELSPICGCAIAAGLGAASAIAYQTNADTDTIGKAINNLAGDISGMLCDGAKGGCSFKVASSARAAIRAAFVAKEGVTIGCHEGIIGDTPEETIKNIGYMSTKGMLLVNDTCVSIMQA